MEKESKEAVLKEVPVKSVLTPRFLVLTIVVGLVMGLLGLFNDLNVTAFRNIITLGMEFSGLIGGPLIFMTFLFLINYGKKRLDLNIQQLTVLYAVTATAAVGGCFRGLWNFSMQIVCLTIPESTQGKWYAGRIGYPWCLKYPEQEQIVRQIFIGGTAVPSEWIVPILWWIVFLWLVYLVIHGLIILFRDRWIEGERVIVPYASGFYNTLILQAGGEHPERSRYALIGVIAGFLLFLPWMLRAMFPWLPDLYGWSKAPYNAVWPGQLELPLAFPATQTLQIASTWIPLSPLWFFLMYWLPIETQISGFVFYLLMAIIYPITASAAGLMPIDVMTSGWSGHVKAREPPLYTLAMSDIGAYLGLWVWPLIFSWRAYADSFKRIMKPSSEGPPQPVSGRIAILMVLVGFFGMYAMIVAGGGSPVIYLPWLFIWAIWMINAMRLRSEVGWYLEQQYTVPSLYFVTLFPSYTNETIDFQYTLNNVLNHSLITRLGVSTTIGPIYTAIDSYKMAYENRAHPKDVFKAHFIGRAIGLCLLFPLIFVISYSVGLFKTPGGSGIFGSGSAGAWPPDSAKAGPSLYGHNWTPAAIAGFAIAGLLTFLRSRFVWWPLNTAGFIIGTGTMTTLTGLGFVCGQVLLAKYILLRMLGTAKHDKIVVPFMAGFAGGYSISIISGFLTMTLRAMGIV